MAIAGELTWWAPAPLKKVAEYVNISEREKLPVATVSTEDHMEG